MNKTRCSFPDAVAIAEQFLWKILLTSRWDYLFPGPVFPHHLETKPFVPRTRVWWPGLQIEEDEKLIKYSQVLEDGSIESTAIVGMKYSCSESGWKFWEPNSFSCQLYIFDDHLESKYASKILIIPPTKIRSLLDMVREKTKQNV